MVLGSRPPIHIVASERQLLLLSFDVSELLCWWQGLYLVLLAMRFAVLGSAALVILLFSTRCYAGLAGHLALVLRS